MRRLPPSALPGISPSRGEIGKTDPCHFTFDLNERRSWTVIRFWNDDVLQQIDDVCLHILRSIPREQS
ncbi:DUF559 domain-containing protein [Agrobacterium larrymoorei]|uniref:DUF559 domain-containing protein n=1 Tax=Agrobacterium larrymoorei TaxID=160699 RepID=UPI00286CCFEE|nr:DUF559 domain-containing protein [Agrobacterium larrymoorei]